MLVKGTPGLNVMKQFCLVGTVYWKNNIMIIGVWHTCNSCNKRIIHNLCWHCSLINPQPLRLKAYCQHHLHLSICKSIPNIMVDSITHISLLNKFSKTCRGAVALHCLGWCYIWARLINIFMLSARLPHKNNYKVIGIGCSLTKLAA